MTQVGTEQLRPTRTQMENLGWRSLWTFVQASSGMLVGEAIFDWNVGTLELAAAAGIAAVISVVKNFASRRLGTQ